MFEIAEELVTKLDSMMKYDAESLELGHHAPPDAVGLVRVRNRMSHTPNSEFRDIVIDDVASMVGINLTIREIEPGVVDVWTKEEWL